MKQGKLQPAALVSLRDVPGPVVRAARERRRPGARARPRRWATWRTHPRCCASFPAIAEAASWIGSVQVRNRATVGGNLCNAAPSADMAPILIAYGASATITDGARRAHGAARGVLHRARARRCSRPGELLTADHGAAGPGGQLRQVLQDVPLGDGLAAPWAWRRWSVFAPGAASRSSRTSGWSSGPSRRRPSARLRRADAASARSSTRSSSRRSSRTAAKRRGRSRRARLGRVPHGPRSRSCHAAGASRGSRPGPRKERQA